MFGSFIVSALPATSLGYFVGISLTQEISASGKPTMHQAWAKKSSLLMQVAEQIFYTLYTSPASHVI